MLTKQEITRFISDDMASEQKRKARIGQNYYEGKHDIRNYRIFYFDADGVLQEDRYRSNVKIPHPFFTELVNQAVQYIFSGDKIIRSENPKLQKYLDEYFNFNEEFTTALSELVAGCMKKGREYLYIYLDSNGKPAFQTADSLCITEVDAKDSSDNKEYIIYSYADTLNHGKRKIKRIQVWDTEHVHYYIQTENGVVIPDETQTCNPLPHILLEDEKGDQYSESFGFLPFFRLDNNSSAVSDLWIIKELIDDYDLMASSLSNNLIDFDMPLYAVSGFDGDNLDELQQNLKSKKIVGLEEGGGVEIKTIDVPYQARQAKLELDEKNIYRFGMGLNINGIRDTSATTNIAIKAAYSLLDLKCAMLETRLKQFLCRIAEPVIEFINTESGSRFDKNDLHFEFTHQVMSNAYENAQIQKLTAEENDIKIQTLMSVSQLLDDETIVRNICSVMNINYDEISEKINRKKRKKLDIENAMQSVNQNQKSSGPLNGAQMSSLLAILSQYKQGNLSADTAAAVISVSFGITEDKAARLINASDEQSSTEESAV